MYFPGPYIEPATPRASAKGASEFSWCPLEKEEHIRRLRADKFLDLGGQEMDFTRSSQRSLSPALKVRACAGDGKGSLPSALALAMASGFKISSSCCPSNDLPSEIDFAVPSDSSYFSPRFDNSFHNSHGDQNESSGLLALHYPTWAGHDSYIDTWEPISGRKVGNSDCGDFTGPSEPFLGPHLRVNAPRPRG